MSPQQDQSPGLPLPQPSFDTGQVSGVGMPPAYQPLPNQAQAQPPRPYATQMANVAQPSFNAPTNVPAAQVPPRPLATASVQDAPADDETAADQEWVTKAREIVVRTHNDPYLQSKELGKIKAQYIKVRYNKDIKTVEE